MKLMTWVDRSEIALLQLPNFLAKAMPASGPWGLWLQADGCCSRASWVEVEVTPDGYVYLNRGWQTLARARGLKGRRHLLFKYDGEATLVVKIFESRAIASVAARRMPGMAVR
ncbi:Heat shock cognate 70 kDa protein 1 [Hordeum vulgare]|nr:Heat shock cognate 70 kDa protein 1 [Hordeum vulgare]